MSPIPGVDMAMGLQRAMGQMDLYLSLLGKFRSRQGHTVEQLRLALQGGHWQTAERLAHTLKGSAAQIGAVEIRDRAGELEASIRGRDALSRADAMLDGLAPKLEALFAAIACRLPAPMAAEAAERIDSEHLSNVCLLLACQLDSFNCSSTQTMKNNEAMLRAALGDRYDECADFVDDFEFDKALELLRSLVIRHGISI